MKVKYIGTTLPKYTGKTLEVKRFVNAGVILYLPEEDQRVIEVERAGIWGASTLLCTTEEIEEVTE